MTTEETEDDGWAIHEREQARAWLALSPLERLRWLDGAKEFAQKYGGQGAETALAGKRQA